MRQSSISTAQGTEVGKKHVRVLSEPSEHAQICGVNQAYPVKSQTQSRMRKSNSLISQWSPSQPSAQIHWYTLTLSIHVPPFSHGLLSQSLMSGRKRREMGMRIRPSADGLLRQAVQTFR